MKVRGWWSREALLASPVRPERFLFSVSAVTQRGFVRDHHVAGRPARSVCGAPTGSSRRGQASRPSRAPTAPSGVLAEEAASGPAVSARWALFPGPCALLGVPSFFLSRKSLGVSGHGCALCLPRVLELTQTSGGASRDRRHRERCVV
jgi:hypothetical protein